MTEKLSAFPFEDTARWLASGQMVPFLGSGASKAGLPNEFQLPDGKTLASDLIRKMGRDFPNAAEQSLAKVSQFYEYFAFDRSALREYLAERLERHPGAPTSCVASLLAAIPQGDRPLHIITTNYDTSIERAFSNAGRGLCVITQAVRDPTSGLSRIRVQRPDGGTSEGDAKTFTVDTLDVAPGTAFLFKMHGSLGEQHRPGESGDNLIITEDDYVDFMIGAGSALSPVFPPPSLLAEYKFRRFLFLGYSLEDWNFRIFLRVLQQKNALSTRDALRHWAVQLGPSVIEAKLWEQRNVRIFDGDLVEFCTRMGSLWKRS